MEALAKTIQTDYWPHPITTEGREPVMAMPGQTLEEVFRFRIPHHARAIAVVNGAVYAREKWKDVVLREGDMAQVRLAVGGDLNPFAVIASIAVLVAAPLLAPAVAGAFGVTSAVGIGVAEALISVGGILLANSLFPPRIPRSAARQAVGRAERLYTLSGGANRARPYQPLQLLLGTHRQFPDLVAQEYTEFNTSGDQFLNTIMDFGLGNIQQGTLKIGETDVTSYEEVTTQSNVTAVTLVAGNVDTIAGGDLEYNVALERTTAADTTAVAFDLVVQHFRQQDDGSLLGVETSLSLRWRKAGTSDAFTGHTVSIPTADGADARNATRRSYKYDTAEAASWDVQITLNTTIDEMDDRLTFSASGSFRAYQNDAADFTGRHPLAMRAKATGQLYGRLDSVNAINSQLVNSWNGSNWQSNQVSGNCGDVLLAYLRGWFVGGRLVAGMGLLDDRIDLPSIQEFADHCTDNELECNVVLEDGREHNEVLTLICQCGWGSIDRQSGKWGVIWEDAGRAMTAIINPDNVIAGSMAVVYNHENLADEVIGNFIDRMSDYAVNQIRRMVPGETNPQYPVEVDLEGIVNGEHAAKELNRQVAAQFYHTRTVAWEMALEESISIARGDVVGATHGIVGSGDGGRFLAIDMARTAISLNRDVASSGKIWIWDLNDEVIERNYTRSAAAEITLSAALPSAPSSVGDDPHAYRFMTFPSDADVVRLRVVGKKPSSSDRVRFIARDEVIEYYDHRTSDLTWQPIPRGTAAYLSPVEGFLINENELGVRIFSWAPHDSPSVVGYQIRYSAVSVTKWDDMDPLHEGTLLSSPAEYMDRPAAGTYRFGIVAILDDGRRTVGTFRQMTFGDVIAGLDGEDGNGVEYIFAATTNPSIPMNQRPSNDWGFDQPMTIGGLRWYDGAAENYSVTVRYMWRAERAVPGTPAVGTAITENWKMPRIVGVWGQTGSQGIAGADGDDGNGVEYIFAVNNVLTIPANQRPDNDWGFDSPSTQNGLTWHDGAPGITSSTPYLWRSQRAVPGVPAQGAAVTAQWSMPTIVGRFGSDGAVGAPGADGADAFSPEYIFAKTDSSTLSSSKRPSNSWGFEEGGTSDGVRWTDGAPDLDSTNRFLWRASRKVPGGVEDDDDVSDNWSTPIIVGVYGTDGVPGADGVDGYGREFIFAKTSTITVPTSQYPSNSWGFDDGGTRGGLTWTDGAPDLDSDDPFLWRCERDVSGTPADGAAVTDDWSAPALVGRYGIDGVPGADGADAFGIEYIFARTAGSVSSIPSSQRPSNSWGYDQPTTRGGLTWSDAAPGLTSSLQLLWSSQRRITGAPAVGDAVTANWTTPAIVGRYGEDGDPADIGDGDIITRMIALSATAELRTASTTSQMSNTDANDIVDSISISGGSGYKVLLLGSFSCAVQSDSDPRIRAQLYRGSNELESSAYIAPNRYDVARLVVVADDDARSGSHSYNLRIDRSGAGDVDVYGAEIQAFIAKR